MRIKYDPTKGKTPGPKISLKPFAQAASSAVYAERDPMALGDYYVRHVAAMTSEELHAKAAIAAELAWRDEQIDRLLDALRSFNAHYDDLCKSNPGFMGKLCLQNYALWNEALLKSERVLARYPQNDASSATCDAGRSNETNREPQVR